ncbi:MAG TPA: GNAT family N-acetyltransferase, partial [Sulfitobacter sp.]|nr:GNAT family N-acetyltransferase [Sulfitobacter sp.]
MPSNLRDLTPQDTDAAALLFFAAVHQGTADVYSAEQRIAWAGEAPAPAT